MAKPLTQAKLAQLLGISQQQVSYCVRKGMPADDLAAARRWRAGNLNVAKAKPPPDSGRHRHVGDLAELRKRKLAAEAVRLEHAHQLALGKYVLRADAIKSVQRAGMAARDAMLSLPGRLAAQVASLTDERAIERLLTEAIRAELTRLADSVAPPADA